MSTAVQTKTKLPGLISVLLITVLGISVAKLMWLVITPKQLISNQAGAVDAVISKPKIKINYGKNIADQHLFGKVEIKKAVVTATPTETKTPVVTATKLNLKLHGIVSYKSTKSGFALISSGSGRQKVYGEGDELQTGVTVSNIFSDKVVLDNNGKSEDLLLPVKKENSAAKYSSANNSDVPNLLNNQPQNNFNSKSSAAINLGSIRQKALSSPQSLLDVARPSPAIINGKFTGFRVQPGRKRKLFRQLGFRPNDVITEVNGIRLDDAGKGAMVLGELSQASELSVTVKRGSQEVYIQHTF
ncbi:MAG: type II secretion system protein GspC [Cocleimonas sp.]